MKLFTEMATHCINKTISTNGFEILPEVIRQHTDWDYAYQQKAKGCSLKPTFRNMPYRNSFVPEIDVVISNCDSQTELQMIGQPVKFVRVFMALWFSFLLVMEFFFVILAITSNLDSLFLLLYRLLCVHLAIYFVSLERKQLLTQLLRLSKKNFTNSQIPICLTPPQ